VTRTAPDRGLLGLRLVLGGYLAAHGAQKLFGAFDGHGLDTTAAGFERLGLRPARGMALLAAGSELAGGLLTAAGLGDPVGPIAIAGAMTVATTVHGDKGPMAAKGGYEMALTNLAAALALAAAGPGRHSLDKLLGRRLPRPVIAAAIIGAAALTGVNASAVVRTRRLARTSQGADGAAERGHDQPPAAEPSSTPDRETSTV
jgi:putative oxidoreductase